MKLSVVIPAYNEAESLPLFIPELVRAVKQAVGESYEIIIVNDGSKDSTLEALKQLADKNSKLRVVDFSRNFGKEIATTAGLFYASGDATIMIDADGQHPPELIPDFIKQWQNGNQVVIGVRESNQKEGLIKRYGSKWFYKLFNATSGTDIIPRATDFRLIDEAVREEFVKFTERNRITRGLIDWMGFRRAVIPFHAEARVGGEASYKVSKLLKLALDSFISLSMAPLYFIGYTGLFITALSFLFGLFMFFEQIVFGDPLQLKFTGTALLSILIVFLVGIILTAQGLVSLYLSHIHSQTQNRPLFIVNRRQSINLPDADLAA